MSLTSSLPSEEATSLMVILALCITYLMYRTTCLEVTPLMHRLKRIEAQRVTKSTASSEPFAGRSLGEQAHQHCERGEYVPPGLPAGYATGDPVSEVCAKAAGDGNPHAQAAPYNWLHVDQVAALKGRSASEIRGGDFTQVPSDEGVVPTGQRRFTHLQPYQWHAMQNDEFHALTTAGY